jgi:hypothetical protein
MTAARFSNGFSIGRGRFLKLGLSRWSIVHLFWELAPVYSKMKTTSNSGAGSTGSRATTLTR